MRSEDLTALMDHMEWADARIWAAVQALPADRAAASDLRERLFHVHLVQQIYLALWRKQPLAAIPALAEYPDLAAVQGWGRSYYAEARALVAAATEAQFAEPVRVPFSERLAPPGGSVTHATLAETVLQVALHTTHHRGQLATRMRDLGSQAPLTDYVVWIWTGRPRAEWSEL